MFFVQTNVLLQSLRIEFKGTQAIILIKQMFPNIRPKL